MDFTHLDAISLRLSHEKARVEMAKTAKDREWRQHSVRMIEREYAGELRFLGVDKDPRDCAVDWDDDLLLAELLA